MKIAGSSAPFDRLIRSGELTQLEWLDACAREFALDGVAFDVRHFPRTDREYVAQLKKLAADLGLTVVALICDDVFAAEPEGGPSLETPGTAARFRLAAGLGAPLLIAQTSPGDGSPQAWTDLIAATKRVARLAKACNVTVGLRNAPGTQCADAAGLKRLAKEVDSSWLRYALDPGTLQATDGLETLWPFTVATFGTLAGARPAAQAFRAFTIVSDYVQPLPQASP